MKKYIAKLKRNQLVFDISKNNSFQYFIDELKKYSSKGIK